MRFQQQSYTTAQPETTSIPGSLADSSTANPAINLVGGVEYGSILDDLSLSFFLRATQAHRDAKMLTAPRVTVLSGESASIKVQKEISYVSDYSFQDITSSGDNQPVRVVADPTTDVKASGVTLNVTPTISADKKYVILAIRTNYTKLNFQPFTVSSSTTGEGFPISLPEREIAEVQTRVSVPDGGTLLIGGQKLGAEINKESGVPGLSKTPIIGRLFSNKSKVKDQDILLILVKPTIILQEEAEREYFAPLE
jgi:type II secretory pathway component GspD/PulD (secretin)